MPKLGLNLGIRTPPTESYDSDALAYFSTAGITDPTAKTQIDGFVIGLKSLNLWNTSVFWPMRLAQNASSGTTEYSLGGYGSHNGTLAGTALPIRNTNGLNFLTGQANSRVDIASIGTLNQPFSFYGCLNFSTSTYSPEVLFSSKGNSLQPEVRKQAGISPFSLQLISGGVTFSSTAKVVGATKFFTSGYFNGASSSVSVDGSSNTGNAGTAGVGSGINIGNNTSLNISNRNMEIAFLMLSTSALNDASIRALYKSTLGDGLGLP
jgi:hypothetical protein